MHLLIRTTDATGNRSSYEQAMRLSVTNYGNPIPENLLQEVFEPYWRPATSAPGGGLGLGLFICKQIVEAHAGTLEVRSSLEQGTCFTARIPLIPTRPN